MLFYDSFSLFFRIQYLCYTWYSVLFADREDLIYGLSLTKIIELKTLMIKKKKKRHNSSTINDSSKLYKIIKYMINYNNFFEILWNYSDYLQISKYYKKKEETHLSEYYKNKTSSSSPWKDVRGEDIWCIKKGSWYFF